MRNSPFFKMTEGDCVERKKAKSVQKPVGYDRLYLYQPRDQGFVRSVSHIGLSGLDDVGKDKDKVNGLEEEKREEVTLDGVKKAERVRNNEFVIKDRCGGGREGSVRSFVSVCFF